MKLLRCVTSDRAAGEEGSEGGHACPESRRQSLHLFPRRGSLPVRLNSRSLPRIASQYVLEIYDDGAGMIRV